MVLPSVRGGLMYVGVWNDGAGDDQWIYGPAVQNFLQLTHGLPAAAATFLFPGFLLIPWQNVVDNLNDAVFAATPGSPIITSLVEQDVFVSYRISIDSTGGGVYTVISGLLVNGSPVANSLCTHQNAGAQDTNLVSSVFKLHMNAGDTLQVALTQVGLTGGLVGAAASIHSLI